MKLFRRHLVLGWLAILLVGLTDYAHGLRLLATTDCAGSTTSSSALEDSDPGTQTPGSESGSSGDSTKIIPELIDSGTGSTNSGTEPSESNGESTKDDKESTEPGTGSTEFGLSTEDSDSTSSDNSNSMTTEPVEVTTLENVLDKKEILEQIQEKLSEIRKLLEMLKSLFTITTTESGTLSTGLSTTEGSDITAEVSTGVPTTKGSDVTAETSTGVPTTLATAEVSTGVPTTKGSDVTAKTSTGVPSTLATAEVSTGVPTTKGSDVTAETSTGVSTTLASEGTTVTSMGVSITVASKGETEASTVVSTVKPSENEGHDSSEESKPQKAEEIADICNPTANEACSELKDAIASIETFTSSFDPTGEVSMSDLTEITQTTSNLNNAVTKVIEDPSGVNPEALNTKLSSVEQSIVSVETKIAEEIQVLGDTGTDNTLAIVLGTLGALLGVAIVAVLVIRITKKKKACKKTVNEAA